MKDTQSFEDYLRERHGPSQSNTVTHKAVPSENKSTHALNRRQQKNGESPLSEKCLVTPWYRNQKFYIIVLMFIGTVLLCFLLYFLPISLGTVIVEGNTKMSSDEVYRVARIGRPVNVLRLSIADINRQLAGDLRIAQVDVGREWPATIRIRVREREPLAIVRTDFGYAVLDEEGLVIVHMETIRDVEAAFVTGKSFGNLVLGDRLQDPLLLKALTYLSHLSSQGRREISEVNIGDAHQIIAYTRDNLPVHLGAGEHMNEQAPLSENMLSDVRARKLEARFVDANIGAPYIKLK